MIGINRRGVVAIGRRRAGVNLDNYWLPNKGKIVITFDESNDNQYTTALPLLQEESAKATFYITATFPGELNRMTWDQVRALNAAGMDIESHGEDHTYFDAMTEEEAIAQLNAINTKFTEESLPRPYHMAYPGNAYTFEVKQWIAPHIRTARSGDQNFNPVFRDSDKLSMNSTCIDNLDAETYYRGGTNGSNVIKGYMDECHAVGGAMILYMHGVTALGSNTSVAKEKLRALIQHAKSIGMQVMTMKDLYGIMDHAEPVVLEEAVLTVTSGTGTDVATFYATVREDTTFTLDGTAKFYTDAAGTEGESTIWECKNYPNQVRVRYVKCPSGISNLKFAKKNLSAITWQGTTSAPSLGGDIGQLSDMKYISIEGNNTVTGDVGNFINLTRLYVAGSNSITGSLAGLTKVTYVHVTGFNTLSGDISGLISATNIHVAGLNTLSGDFTNLTKLTYLQIDGNNTVTGNLNLISNGLTRCRLPKCTITEYTAGGDWSSIIASGLILITPSVGYGLSVAGVSLLLQEISATKVVGRVITIDLRGSNASLSDTSQGGIWGDFDGETSPSDLAIAYKNLVKTDLCTVYLNGITVPGVSGDGTGFPAGFGDWYRS